MKALTDFLSAWWPLLLPIPMVLIALAATAVASFTSALLVAILWLQASAVLGSLLGKFLRRRAAAYPPAQVEPEASAQ